MAEFSIVLESQVGQGLDMMLNSALERESIESRKPAVIRKDGDSVIGAQG